MQKMRSVSAQQSPDEEVFQGLSGRVPKGALESRKPPGTKSPKSPVARADTVNVRGFQKTDSRSSKIPSSPPSPSSVGFKTDRSWQTITQTQRSTQTSRTDSCMPLIVEERTQSPRHGHHSTRSSSHTAQLGSAGVEMRNHQAEPLLLKRKPSIIADFMSQRRATVDSAQPDIKVPVEGDKNDPKSDDSPDSPEVSSAGGTDTTTELCFGLFGDRRYAEVPSLYGGKSVEQTPLFLSTRSVTPSSRYTSSPSVFSQAPTLASSISYSPISAGSPYRDSASAAWSSPVPSLERYRQDRGTRALEKRSPVATMQPLERSNPRQHHAPISSPDSMRAGSMKGASKCSSGNNGPISTLPKFATKSNLGLESKPPRKYSTTSKPGKKTPTEPPPELAHLLLEPLQTPATASSQTPQQDSLAAIVPQPRVTLTEPLRILKHSPYNEDSRYSPDRSDSSIHSCAIAPTQPRSQRNLCSAPPQTSRGKSTLPKPREVRATPTRSNNTPARNEPFANRIKDPKSRTPLSCIWRRDKTKAESEPDNGEQLGFSGDRVIKDNGADSNGPDGSSSSRGVEPRARRSGSQPPLGPRIKPGNSKQQPPLDDFLSKRLQPVYLRGTAALDGDPDPSKMTSSIYSLSTCKDRPRPVDVGNSQLLTKPGIVCQENYKVTTPSTVQQRDQPDCHSVKPSDHVEASVQSHHSGLPLQSQGYGSTVSGTESQLKPKRSHWSLFQKDSKLKSLQTKNLLQRALGLAVKHSSNEAMPTTGTAAPAPKGRDLVDRTKIVQYAVDTSHTPCASNSFRSFEANHGAAPRSSQDQTRSLTRPQQTVLPSIRRSEELPRREFSPTRIPSCSSTPEIARQIVVDAVSMLGSPASLPRQSAQIVRSEAPSDGHAKPSSGHLSRDAVHARQTTDFDRCHVSSTQTVISVPQDVGEKPYAETRIPNTGHGQPKINIWTPIRQKPSRNNLDRVLEEDFLTFSVCRDSGSSYSSSSGTFYFPLTPSQPPKGGLPRLPCSATGSDVSISKNAQMLAPPSQNAAMTSDVEWISQVIIDNPDAIGPTMRSYQTDSIAYGSLKAKNGLATNDILRINSSRKRNSGLPRPTRNDTSNSLPNSKLSKSGKSSTADGSVATNTKQYRTSTGSLLAVDAPAMSQLASAKAMSMADLRFASLMTSRWLSFGRVLFSPAHTELKDPAQDRILVIDGLGKDWSYYCALTYPNAQIHALSLSSTTCPSTASMTGRRTLSNHREISHPDLTSSFPFPRSYFAATVFRFPVATTDAALKFAISECTRVLRPGGYIEISALDLDLALMGNRARRSVRELKMRLHGTDPETSLKPASDNMQRLLGRSGFEKLNRCVIGVPAVGSVAGSRANSLDERTHSFRDLVKDESEGSDEGIAKMVSKVGRWWYTQCYERGDVEHSIWNEKLLLKECEELQTTFKLLICYAQKPMVPKRRASSL